MPPTAALGGQPRPQQLELDQSKLGPISREMKHRTDDINLDRPSAETDQSQTPECLGTGEAALASPPRLKTQDEKLRSPGATARAVEVKQQPSSQTKLHTAVAQTTRHNLSELLLSEKKEKQTTWKLPPPAATAKINMHAVSLNSK